MGFATDRLSRAYEFDPSVDGIRIVLPLSSTLESVAGSSTISRKSVRLVAVETGMQIAMAAHIAGWIIFHPPLCPIRGAVCRWRAVYHIG